MRHRGDLKQPLGVPRAGAAISRLSDRTSLSNWAKAASTPSISFPVCSFVLTRTYHTRTPVLGEPFENAFLHGMVTPSASLASIDTDLPARSRTSRRLRTLYLCYRRPFVSGRDLMGRVVLEMKREGDA